MGLLNDVSTLPRLRRAWSELNRTYPSSHGPTGVTIRKFGLKLDEHLRFIQLDLRNNRFTFGKYRAVTIPKRSSGVRPIAVADVRDRVVLKAITKRIYPILNSRYKLTRRNNFAFLPRRGVKQAIEKVKYFYERGFHVALKIDIKDFFGSIDRQHLLNELVFPVLAPDVSLNGILIEALTQEAELGEVAVEHHGLFTLKDKGIPQGSALSPLLANIYLANFDRIMSKRGYKMVRYADDIVIMSKDIKAARAAHKVCEDELFSLGLLIHPLGSGRGKYSEIIDLGKKPLEYLSICFDGKNMWPAKNKLLEFEEKVSAISLDDKRLNVPEMLRGTQSLLRGWLSAFHFVDVDRYLSRLDHIVNVNVAEGLKRRGWFLKGLHAKNSLTPMLAPGHRVKSGIPTAKSILTKIRTSVEERETRSAKVKIKKIV